MKERKKILTMLVENNYGVTSRVSGMFSRRGFNLDSFTGCDTLDPRFSRITVVVHGDEQVLEQIEKQVRKLEDVIYVTDLTAVDSVCRYGSQQHFPRQSGGCDKGFYDHRADRQTGETGCIY